jgi:hypothetical protein
MKDLPSMKYIKMLVEPWHCGDNRSLTVSMGERFGLCCGGTLGS